MAGIVFANAVLPTDFWRIAQHEKWLSYEGSILPHLTLGRISNGILNCGQPAFGERFVVFIDGELYKREAVWNSIVSGEAGCPTDDQHFILELLRRGLKFSHIVPSLEGAFFIAAYDARSHLVTFASDRFGLRPHYWSSDSWRFILSPEVKLCLAQEWVSRDLDPLSLAEYFSFQCILGERTLYRAVQCFPAGSVGIFDLQSKRFSVRAYNNCQEIVADPFKGSFQEATEVGSVLFKSVVSSMLSDRKRHGIYLSGGLDSRLILAASEPRSQDLHTFTFGPKESPDQVYATRCASVAGTRHHSYFMDDGRWIAALAGKHTSLTEGFHCLLHAHNLWRADEARQWIDVNLNGHFGDLLLGGSYIHGPVYSILPRLLQTFQSKWGSAFALPEEFEEAWELEPGFDSQRLIESFRNAFASYAGLPQPIATDLFALQFHGRKQIQYYMVHNQPYFESRVPFLDIELLKFIYSLPVDFRRQRRLQVAMLHRLDKKLAQIEWTGTQLPAYNHGWPCLRSRMKSHTNKLAGRWYGHSVFSPKGTVFNDRYGDWLATDLAAWIQAMLCDPGSQIRGFFKAGYIEWVVQNHITGRVRDRASSFKLGLMLTLEILLRHTKGLETGPAWTEEHTSSGKPSLILK